MSERNSAAMRRRWADPRSRQRLLQAIQASWRRRRKPGPWSEQLVAAAESIDDLAARTATEEHQ